MEIRAIEVTSNSVGDAPMLPELLAQIASTTTISTVTGDGAYDTKACHAAIVRIPAQAGHGFQSKLDSDSDGSWTPIPGQAGQPEVIT